MLRRYVLAGIWIAIPLLCAGLLMPAIHKTREAAARMACHSHFKGLATALYMYGSSRGEVYPLGAVLNSDLPPNQRLSWVVLVLPYLEQDAVFKQFDLTHGPGDPKNEKPTSNRFRHLVCPASDEHDRGTESWKSPSPVTHYIGVAGVGADAAELPLGHARAGVFGYDRRTAIEDIPDGTSNTLLLIETANNPGHWAFGGTATVRAFERESAYIGPGRSFGGFHNGGMVLFGEREHICTVAFADTSVRSLTTKIAPVVLEAIATVGGKEELPVEW